MSSTALKRKSTVVEDLLASESDEEEEDGDANANESSDDAPELAAHEKFGQRKRKLPRSLVGTEEVECELLRSLVFL